MFRRAISTCLLGMLCVLATACGREAGGPLDVVVVAEPGEGDRDDSSGDANGLLQAATTRGLVEFDAEARIAPGAAESWIVADDGMSYIFRLPADDEVQRRSPAERTRRALVKNIRALKGTPLGLDFAIVDAIRARTDRVVEISLTSPMPEFLQLLAQPQMAIQFGGENDPVPFRLEKSETGDEIVPAGAVTGGARTLRLAIAPPKEAVARFQGGDADILIGGNIDALPYVEKGGLLRGSIRMDPVSGLFGLAVARAEGFLDDPANREAVALSIDRQALIEPFNIGGWTPRARIVGHAISPAAGERWAGLALEDRRAVAAGRIAGWQAVNGKIAPLAIALPEGRGGDILFSRLRADFASVGLEARRVAPDAVADLVLIDQVASYGRPEWFLNRLSCRVMKTVCSQEADAVVAAARSEQDSAARDQMLIEAERMITATNGFIAFGPPVRFSLVRGGIAGFAVNVWGVHPLSQLALGPS